MTSCARRRAQASSLWRKWFGEFRGPINDECFQDGGAWDGPPHWVDNLVPAGCVVNR